MPAKEEFKTILSEHYAGTELEHIDHLQSNWRRGIVYSLDDRLGDRIYDLLICIREGMLNAFIHGCERSPEKFAHLELRLNGDGSLLRVFIDDPGKGHSFKLLQPDEASNPEAGSKLGLGIIQHLSDALKVDNRGTSLVFEFKVPGKAA